MEKVVVELEKSKNDILFIDETTPSLAQVPQKAPGIHLKATAVSWRRNPGHRRNYGRRVPKHVEGRFAFERRFQPVNKSASQTTTTPFNNPRPSGPLREAPPRPLCRRPRRGCCCAFSRHPDRFARQGYWTSLRGWRSCTHPQDEPSTRDCPGRCRSSPRSYSETEAAKALRSLSRQLRLLTRRNLWCERIA